MSKNESEQCHPSAIELLEMLGYGLLEIRSTDNLALAKAIADIFHNLPPSIIKYGISEIDSGIAYGRILKKAKKYGLEKYIDDLRKAAMNLVRD